MSYEKWRPRLANANDPALIPITYIDGLLNEGLAQFWATPDAAMVTQITVWPGGAKTLRSLAAAGKKADLTGPIKDRALAWAKANGCTHAMPEGRAGWQRALPDFRLYQTILLKEL